MKHIERYLIWGIWAGIGLLLLTPFVVTGSMFFPFITGKNFFFRIVTELLFGVWVSLALFDAKYRPQLSSVAGALTIFVGVISVAGIFGVDPYHSFWSNLERMEGIITHLHLLALFMVVAHTLHTKREWYILAHGFLGVSCVTAIHAFLQYTGALEIVGAYRPYATFGNSIYLAGYLIFSLFLALLFLLHEKRLYARIAYSVLIAFEFFVFFVAASRGAFIGFTVGALVMLALLAVFERKRFFYIIGGIGVSLIAGLILLILLVPSSRIVQRVELFSRLASVSFADLTQDPRVMVWEIGLDAFQARPLLGWGPENFIVPFAQFYNPAFYGNEPWFDRTHNMFLEWLVAGGIVGFAAYISMFGTGFWMIIRLVRDHAITQRTGIVLASILVAYVVQNAFVFDNIISYITIILFFAFLHSQGITVRSIPRNKSAIFFAQFIVCCVTLVTIYSVNIPALLAARNLNKMLVMISQAEPVDKVFEQLDTIVRANTFATAEARERLADFALEIAPRFEGKPSPEGKQFLKKAIDVLRLQRSDDPLNLKYPLFLGRALLVDAAWNKTSFQEVEDVYKEALSMAPQYVSTHMALAELYLATSRFNEARSLALDIFRKAPQSSDMFYDTLTVLVISDDPLGARQVLLDHAAARQLRRMPESFQSDRIVQIASRATRISDISQRIIFLEELQSWSAPSPELYLILAQNYADTGNLGKSKEYAYKAVELKPDLKPQIDAFFKNRTK